MNFSFVGKPTVVSQALKETTTDKLSKLSKFLPEGTDITVTYKVTKLENKIDVTFNAFKRTMRAESKAQDMYSAIDDVTEILEKQLRRLKSRLNDKSKKGRGEESYVYEQEDTSVYETPIIIRRKSFLVEPLEIEDAIMQMELSGHKFYLFRDIDTNEVNVVYKTKIDNNYGLIEPN